MKKINIFLFATILMMTSATVYAQCDVTANIYPAEICVGDPVTLTATGGCGYLMSNDFNNGTPGAGWVATTGVDRKSVV